ncbi:LysM peptidoglycan-binding domain-containing protein, partial [Phascolarctobacterium faecium]|uniref:LysM peptidoglycan-binding domain-containing protein n=1 Tax=Phascolarctobacterium faecium TaxID=33025 RepID=UPI003AB3BB6D
MAVFFYYTFCYLFPFKEQLQMFQFTNQYAATTLMYNVSAKAICEANPGLSAENFRIGQVILIPLEKEPTN